MTDIPDNEYIQEAYEREQERRIRRKNRLAWEEAEYQINLENEENQEDYICKNYK
jgi:hypothetical protein